jgi:hypothetical protein
MTRLPRLLPACAAAAALAAAAAVPAIAGAAPPWTAPLTIPGAAPTPAPLIVTADGHALAFPAADRTAAAPAGAVTESVALDPATGAPAGPVHGLPVASVLAAAYGRDRFVLAGSTLDARGTISDASHVQVGYGTHAGDLGPLKGIAGSTGEHAFALDANRDGVVAIVVGDTRERRLLVRRPDGRGLVQAFRTAVTSQARGATVAVGAQGDVLMVWEDQHHVSARHVGPAGGVGAVHRIGDGVQSHLQAAVDAGGRLLAAWVSQRVDEGESATPASVFFATAAPGHGFGPARRLEDAGTAGVGRYVADPAVRLVATGGATVLAWTGTSPATGHFVVKAMPIAGGHRGSVQTVSDPAANAVLGDLSVDDAGRAGLIWRTGVAGADPDGTPQQLQSALRPAPAQPFGAPEAIATPAGATLPYAPRIVLAPATGTALAEVGTFASAGTATAFAVAARPAP